MEAHFRLRIGGASGAGSDVDTQATQHRRQNRTANQTAAPSSQHASKLVPFPPGARSGSRPRPPPPSSPRAASDSTRSRAARSDGRPAKRPRRPSSAAKPARGCHAAEAELWSASQHSHAMASRDRSNGAGRFLRRDASIITACIRASFAGTANFWSRPTGRTASSPTFEVKYTFGIDPLQQYLVEFPDGRLQALSIAWDTRPKDKAASAGFTSIPNEDIKHDDVLHWTKLNQNWNFMCAECHSTGVRKNYDAANDRFATTWAEISVGCEACHGQGSRHVAWAREQGSWWPFGKHDDDPRACRPFRRAPRRQPGRPIRDTGSPRRNVDAGDCCARRSRPAACATPAARDFPKTGCPADGCRTRSGGAARARALLRRRADAGRGL